MVSERCHLVLAHNQLTGRYTSEAHRRLMVFPTHRWETDLEKSLQLQKLVLAHWNTMIEHTEEKRKQNPPSDNLNSCSWWTHVGREANWRIICVNIQNVNEEKSPLWCTSQMLFTASSSQLLKGQNLLAIFCIAAKDLGAQKSVQEQRH